MKEPINIGDLDPQQRLDVARGEKLGADGLEICAYEREWSSAGIEPYKERNANGRMAWPFKFKLLPLSKMKLRNDDVELCRLTDAQRLLSQLREELAQRDAEVSKWKALAQGVTTILDIEQSRQERSTRLGLESQQAANVGGECCTPSAEENELLRNGDYTPEELWGGPRPTCPKCIRAALSPAGGGVSEELLAAFPLFDETGLSETEHHCEWSILQERKRLQAILNAKPHCATCNDNGRIGGPSFYAPDEGGEPCPDCTKPQANSQEGQP